MTVIKQYNTGTSAWEPIVSGVQGPTGPTGPTGPAVTAGTANQILYKDASNVLTGNSNFTYTPTGFTLGGVPFFVTTGSAVDGQALKYSSSLGVVTFEEVTEPTITRTSGKFYGPTFTGPSSVNTAYPLTTNTIYFIPFYSPRKTTYSKMGFSTGSSFAGTGVFRCGIFSNSNGMPLNRLADWGSVTATAANTTYEVFASGAYSGWVWIALAVSSAATTTTVKAINPTGNGYTTMLGTANANEIYAAMSVATGYSLTSGLSGGTMPASITQSSLAVASTNILPYLKAL